MDEKIENERNPSATDPSEEKINERRRALVRAGWTVPIVTSVAGLSTNAAFAASPHGDGHGDAGQHTDAPHSDAPHSDAPHDDAPYSDIHGDAPSRIHGDSHDDITVLHVDTPHLDVSLAGQHADIPHLDTAFAHGDTHSDSPGF